MSGAPPAAGKGRGPRSAPGEVERIQPADRAEWRRWLEEHHATSRGVWFVSFKQRTGRQALTYEEQVEEALCFGWIDSRMNPIDAERAMLMYTPRRPGSPWARSNKQRIERLEATGLMTEAGRRVIEAAKADGSWNALDDVEELREPDDLSAALDAHREARRNWNAFPRTARRGFLWWIASAKRPPTRESRIRETVAMSAANRRLGDPTPRE